RRDSYKVLTQWGACLIWEMLAKSLARVRALWCAGGMDCGLTLSARKEITKKEAFEYIKASKKAKGVILDRIQAGIGCSGINARRQITNALKRRGPASAVTFKPRSRIYGYDTVKILQRVWLMTG